MGGKRIFAKGRARSYHFEPFEPFYTFLGPFHYYLPLAAPKHIGPGVFHYFCFCFVKLQRGQVHSWGGSESMVMTSRGEQKPTAFQPHVFLLATDWWTEKWELTQETVDSIFSL